jgi:hypothetical protein
MAVAPDSSRRKATIFVIVKIWVSLAQFKRGQPEDKKGPLRAREVLRRVSEDGRALAAASRQFVESFVDADELERVEGG